LARISIIAGAIAVVAAIVLLGVGSGVFVDALWFRQLGVLPVFRTILLARLACFARPRVTGPPAAAGPAETSAATTARAHCRAALDALRNGDWAGFGREMEALGKALEP